MLFTMVHNFSTKGNITCVPGPVFDNFSLGNYTEVEGRYV